MASEGSVAPKERVNIVYKSAIGDAKEQTELPFRQLVLGDFTQREDSTPLDERAPIDIDKDTFDDVLKAQNLALQFQVPDRLSDADTEEQIAVDLKIDSMKDFRPDSLVEQIPELKQLIALRDALKALTGPLGNVPDFRKKLEALVRDDATRARLLEELGVNKEA